MELIVIGSGTSVPHPYRSQPAMWLEHEGHTLLMDIGPSAIHRIAEEGLAWAELDAIWISHFHLDHCGGLASFLFSVRYAPQTQARRKPLKIVGGVGLKNFLHTIDAAHESKLLLQPFPVSIHEIEPHEEFEVLPNLRAVALLTPHTIESLALRLTDTHGRRFVYTSDTGYDESLVTFCSDVDLLLIECSYRMNKPVDTHLEFADVMMIANEANPRRLMLTHMYPEWDGVDALADAKSMWTGETIIAVDGLRIEI